MNQKNLEPAKKITGKYKKAIGVFVKYDFATDETMTAISGRHSFSPNYFICLALRTKIAS